ncbi:DUF550 domain-containing protein [Klebsiella pneumoniae]|uniref:DUF550 domain-containing protein n=1 Tax=Klebsiella pneumoniae TaxID=573 RepID=UPI00351D203D
MTSKLTREENAQAVFDLKAGYTLGLADIEILKRVARMALAAMDSEPAIIVGDDGGDALSYRRLIQSFAPGTKLYRHAQPAPNREQVRREHAEWSQATFGNVGPIGPLKHLRREVLEVIAKPHDLIEWADMQFLLWDAQRRAGINDEKITQAMIEKLAVNKQREWPEPKDGEPRLHIKSQPAPVVLKDHKIRELVNQLRDIAIKYHAAGQLREQIARVVRAAFQAQLVCTCPSGDGSLRWPCPAHPGNPPAHSGLRPEQSSIAPAQDGNSPVIPDGLIGAVNRLLDSDGSRGCYSAMECYDAHKEIESLLTAAPQEVTGE